jgi:hypothetical protein
MSSRRGFLFLHGKGKFPTRAALGVLIALPASAVRASDASDSSAIVLSSPWSIQVAGVAARPEDPAAFTRDSSYGFGLQGGLQRRVAGRFAVGLEAEFLHFMADDAGGNDVTGGARRFGRVSVPIELRLHEDATGQGSRIALRGSAGYVHESSEPISSRPTRPRRADGIAYTGGILYSRFLFARTRLAASLRFQMAQFSEESPRHTDLTIGIEAPLTSKR